MSNMSDFLAGIYGTNAEPAPNYNNEIEKLAQAELLDSLFQKEAGVSINDLTVGEVVKVATELFGEDSPLVQNLLKEAGELPPALQAHMEGGEEEEEEEEEEASEKKAAEVELLKMAQNADTSGRIMAHAYWQELQAIKQAAEKEPMYGEGEQKKDEKKKEKEASAFSVVDALARAHLDEIQTGQEKRASLESAVEKRMRELAAERGFSL